VPLGTEVAQPTNAEPGRKRKSRTKSPRLERRTERRKKRRKKMRNKILDHSVPGLGSVLHS
jgi:hypothetical protein